MQIGLLKVKASVKAEEAFCSLLRADVVGDEFRCGSTWLLCVSSLQQGVLDGGALALSSCVRSWNDKKAKIQKNAMECYLLEPSYPLLRNWSEFLLWHRQNPKAAQINDANKIVVIACFFIPLQKHFPECSLLPRSFSNKDLVDPDTWYWLRYLCGCSELFFKLGGRTIWHRTIWHLDNLAPKW